jgi:hypothetical protein
VKAFVQYMRANPQVFVLFVVCVVLGIGTFLAVVVAIISSGTTTPNGEPSGLILPLRAAVGLA